MEVRPGELRRAADHCDTGSRTAAQVRAWLPGPVDTGRGDTRCAVEDVLRDLGRAVEALGQVLDADARALRSSADVYENTDAAQVVPR